MQPPHQHSRINLAEFKAQIARKVGPERSKKYFDYLNSLLSLKLNKVEFNKLCLGIIGRDNIPLHNQFIHSILKNACTAKVPPPTNEVEVPNAARLAGNKEPPRDGYQHIVSHPGVNQVPNPPALSNGDILPQSPRKTRTVTRKRRLGDLCSTLGPNGKTVFSPQQSSSTQCSDFNNILEIKESTASDVQRLVQHHQGLNLQRENRGVEVFNNHLTTVSILSADGTVSAHSQDQDELSIKEVARRLLQPPLGIPLCAASAGGARRALPLSHRSSFASSINGGGLLDTTTLREHMEQIASSQGLEGVSMDSANSLNKGLDSYLKGLISSCQLLVARSGREPVKDGSHKHPTHLKVVNGIRPGHHYQIQSSRGPSEVMHDHNFCCPISLLDFKVAMELNPAQLGEDWPLLIEKICTRAFEGET